MRKHLLYAAVILAAAGAFATPEPSPGKPARPRFSLPTRRAAAPASPETTSVVGGLPRIQLGEFAELDTSRLPRDPNGQPLVARVNGEGITLDALRRKERDFAQQQGSTMPSERDALRAGLSARLLEEAIDDGLLRQFARRHAIRVTEEAITERIKAENERMPPGRKLQDEARRRGRTMSDVREQVRETILRELCEDRMLFAVRPATDPEVQQHQKSGGANTTGVKEIRLSRILIRPPSDLPTTQALEAAARRAEAVLAEIRGGLSFEDAARQYSDDPLTSSTGGDLGYFLPNMLQAEYRAVVTQMKAGEVSGVIQTAAGSHILTLTDRREGDMMTRLRRLRARAALAEEIAAMRRVAKIERYLEVPASSGK